MTDLANAPNPAPAKPARKASRYLWLLVGFLLVLAAASFAGFWIARAMEVDKPVLIGLLVVTGLSLEGAMWTTAASIGVSVFETRKRIWRWLTGRGWTLPEGKA